MCIFPKSRAKKAVERTLTAHNSARRKSTRRATLKSSLLWRLRRKHLLQQPYMSVEHKVSLRGSGKSSNYLRFALMILDEKTFFFSERKYLEAIFTHSSSECHANDEKSKSRVVHVWWRTWRMVWRGSRDWNYLWDLIMGIEFNARQSFTSFWRKMLPLLRMLNPVKISIQSALVAA